LAESLDFSLRSARVDIKTHDASTPENLGHRLVSLQSYRPIFPEKGGGFLENIMNAFLYLAQAAGSQAQGSPLGILVPFACIGVIFYFLVIRPQSQKAKQLQTLISSLKTGDKVVTSGGIHGLISNVKDATVILKVADNVKIEIDKSAVTTVTKPSAAEVVAVS
jgi:preprotein translocase subunit YajC